MVSWPGRKTRNVPFTDSILEHDTTAPGAFISRYFAAGSFYCNFLFYVTFIAQKGNLPGSHDKFFVTAKADCRRKSDLHFLLTKRPSRNLCSRKTLHNVV